MQRREFIAATAAAGTLPGTITPSAAATAKKAPNILFILADDMGYADLGCFGSRHIRTPRLDRLAREGAKMTDAYANSPVCSPTRLSLMTGRYNVAFHAGLAEPFRAGPWGEGAVPDGYATLPSVLKKAGYRTSLVGKWHLGEADSASPLRHGYDEFFGFLSGGIDYWTHVYRGDDEALRRGSEHEAADGYMTTLLADEAIAAIGRHKEAAKPFFLSLHFNAPHWPWEGPEDFALGTHGSHHDGGSLDVFAQMVESLDRNIGRVLDELDQLALASDTLVIFTSDNGGERYSEVWPFRGAKSYLLEGGIRVPTIVRFPGRVPAGMHSDQMAVTMDWMPTICDAAGVAIPASSVVDGISVLPMLKSRRSVKRELFWRFQGHRQRAMRSGNWKYYRYEDNEFLYDLSVDEHERANRASHEPEIMDAMRKKWLEWNKGMVTDDSIPGYCENPDDQALAMAITEDSNCRVYPGK